MAKLEIPSIIVQSGNSHTPPVMDRAAARTQWSISSQSTYDDDIDPVVQTTNGDTGHAQTMSSEKDLESKVEVKNNNNNLPRTRSKANLKLLKRSHAIKESTSPPPDIPLSPVATSPTRETPSVTNSSNGNLRPTIKREGSSDSNWSTSLSRGNSVEHNGEQTPLNLEQFLSDTINGNAKDRIFLLRIENDLMNFIKDTKKVSHKFGMMSSYQRMLVHRVAHYYNIEHNVDSTGHMVIVTKGKSQHKMPNNKLNFFIRDDLLLSEEPKKSILKRDSASFEDCGSVKSPDRNHIEQPRRSKSFEEREEEYEKARARIFHQEHGGPLPEGEWKRTLEGDVWESQISWENTESSDSTKLHPNSHRPSRLTKVESYETRDALKANSLRSSVSKSYSFGGYDQTSNNRVLTKQDSGSSVSSRVSPSSSGYKSQSQRSDTTMSATPSPSATPHLTTQLSNQSEAFSPDIEQETVLWAVTNMASVPVGSVLINPQTGQPFKNDDGSVYHYDPENPPRGSDSNSLNSSSRPIVNSRKPENGSSGSGRSHESSTSNEPPAPISTATPVPPSTSSYQHVEGANHTVSEMEAGGNSNLMPYHHGPPPAPAPPHHMPVNMYNPAVTYNTPAAQYAAALQPPPVEGYAPSNSQPIAFGGVGGFLPMGPGLQNTFYVPPGLMPGPNPQYDRMNGPVTQENADLCNYLMRLSLVESCPHELTAVPVQFFCPQASPMGQHGSGPANPGMPVYFHPHNAAPAPPPPAPAAAHQPRYQPCGYPYPQPSDRPGAECGYPPNCVTYYSRCQSTQQVAATSYSGGSAAGPMTMGVAMVPPALTPNSRPYHRLPTPPNTPQNGCAQYPLYNNAYPAIPGCYQHFQAANPPSQLPLAPVMRPALHMTMGNSPPMRSLRAATYNGAATRSPVVRDSAPSEPPRHSGSPMRYPTAITPSAQNFINVFRVPYPASNEYLLNSRPPLNTISRLPPSVPFPNLRRSRPRAAAPGPAPSRPVFAASQQQAALATAIESAGHSDHRSIGKL